MASIYSLQGQQLLLLFTMDSHIYSRLLTVEKYYSPYLLSSDYNNYLSSIMINGTLYYSYLSKRNLLTLYGTDNYQASYILSTTPVSTKQISSSILTQLREQPLLLYTVTDSDTKQFSLYCSGPASQQEIHLLSVAYISKPDLHIMPFKEQLLFIICCDGSREFYIMDRDRSVRQLYLYDQPLPVVMPAEAGLETERNAITSHDKEIKAEYESQMNTLKAEIEQLNAIITSITDQYNDLMHVAQRYRDEALKWQNKFLLRSRDRSTSQ